MKNALLTIVLSLFGGPLLAQGNCGLGGVTVTVSPAIAAPGQPVVVTLVNNSGQTIEFATACLFREVDAGSSCGMTIQNILCLTVITQVPNGGMLQQVWDQLDGGAQQVPDGDYSFPIMYRDLASVGYQCCATVRIENSPGDPYCFGIGCPCGNEGAPDSGCLNSSGGGATLGGSGTAAVGSDSLVLNVMGAPANIPGMFFGGPIELAPTPFGDGLRCVGGALTRIEVAFTDAAGGAATSTSISQAEGLVGGELRQYQFWFRDLSGPCSSGFNTSNAYRVTW